MRNRKCSLFLFSLFGLLCIIAITSCGKVAASKSAKEPAMAMQGVIEPAAVLQSAAELLALGEKYLLELNYEQAIVYFTKVIEIEPMNVRAYVGRGNAYVLWDEQLELAKADYEKAIEIDDMCVDGYLGLVDVYIRMSDMDKALEVAKNGYTKTSNEQLKNKIGELESGNISDSSDQPRRRSGYINDVLAWYHIIDYEKGKHTGTTAYDAYGNETGHIDTLYNENGNQIQSSGYRASDRYLSLVKYSYEDGVRVRQDRYNPEGTHTYAILEYNNNGKIRKESWYSLDLGNNDQNKEGRLYSYSITDYNLAGDIINKTTYNKEDVMTEYYKYEDGRVLEQIFLGKDGTITLRINIVYDSNGKLLYSVRTDEEGNVTRIE